MIVLVNPRATRSPNRRFPLSVMAIGAALPEGTSWRIVDGNPPDADPLAEVSELIERGRGTPDPVEVVGVTVMPGPQLVSAVPFTRALKARHPHVPVVWGGNFAGLYPRPVINAPYVDWAVRGQGERTFIELLEILRGGGDPEGVPGLAWNHGDGERIGPERPWVGPDELPPPPYHAIDVDDYLQATVLGRRTGVYQASIGCAYSCNFCGVIGVFGSRQKSETPERTVRHLTHLVRNHGMDGLHFYDNNFFLGEARAVEIAERMEPLGISWWCEARVDALLRFSDPTWRLLRRSGLRMVYCGAEAGSDATLRKMSKKLTTDQVREVAARTREHGIVPEFSFMLGDPDDPEGEIEKTLAFVRELKEINPRMELITYFYTPTPQRGETYGGVDPISGTPERLDDWTRPEWLKWMTHEDPDLPWMTRAMKARVEDFRTVLQSRFPSLHDRRTSRWGRELARILAAPRWAFGRYRDPRTLRAVRRWARLPEDDPQAYGHLRPAAARR